MNMKKLKVVTIVGTRPEIIRLSRVVSSLDRYCSHAVVHTGQNYDHELNEIFYQDLELRRPDAYLGAAGGSAAETIGNVIIGVDRYLERNRPDAVLILGDTNSALSAIPAKRRRIPIFHMEAGNRCFDQRVPEETNRKIVDHVADINLTYSDIAREYLLREGLPPDRIIKIGSPMAEVLAYYRPKIEASDALARLDLQRDGYFIVSAHREENVDSDATLRRLLDVLEAVARRFELPVVLSAHPRTRKRLDAAGLELHPLIRIEKPLSFTDYVNLQINALAVLSDSGTVTEEASILNLRALNLREAHERPEGMEEGAVMMTGLSPERVLQGLEILDSQKTGARRTVRQVADYSVPNVSEKVARILLSYTDYVRRQVWHEWDSGST